MNRSDHALNRRNLLRAAAALSSTSTLAGAALAQTPAAAPTPAGLPARGEFVARNAIILSMDPAIGDLPRGDIHVRDGAIVAVGARPPRAGRPGDRRGRP